MTKDDSARAVRRRVCHASATAPLHQATETVESASTFYIGKPSTATASDAPASASSSTDVLVASPMGPVVPVTTHDGMREANPVTTHTGCDEVAAMTHDNVLSKLAPNLHPAWRYLSMPWAAQVASGAEGGLATRRFQELKSFFC